MKYEIVNNKSKFAGGSALILTVVLSVLLAMIAVLFVLRSSVDSVGTRSVADNKELQYAVSTVVEQLSSELVMDVPGAALGTRLDILGNPQPVVAEYQDYPWDNGVNDNTNPATNAQWKQDDRWLASLEPNRVENPPASGTYDYGWGHISDLYGNRGAAATDNVLMTVANAIIIDGTPTVDGQLADADGDGVADSRWVRVMAEPGPDGIYAYASTDDVPLRTSKGKQVYLALRVVDTGGMLNVNTGYRMDPNDLPKNIGWVDGSRPFQVRAAALAGRLTKPFSTADANGLLIARTGSSLPVIYNDLNLYESSVSKRLDSPTANWMGQSYTPFDIGDELDMRYRYLLDQDQDNTFITRLDRWSWRQFWPTPPQWIHVPQNASQLGDWFTRVTQGTFGATGFCDYRDVTTTYNCDRLIRPDRGPTGNVISMVNANTAGSIPAIYEALKKALNAGTNIVTMRQAAQIAVNIVDFRDIHTGFNDDTVTAFTPADLPGVKVYGFDRPRIALSEIALKSEPNAVTSKLEVGYAVEVHLLDDCADVNDWQIVVTNGAGAVKSARLLGNGPMLAGTRFIEGGVIGTLGVPGDITDPNLVFDDTDVIELQRRDSDKNWMVWDSRTINDPNVNTVKISTGSWSVERNVEQFQWIKHDWKAPNVFMTLGAPYSVLGVNSILAETEDKGTIPNDAFRTIGDLGMVFAVDARAIDAAGTEGTTRVDWTNPLFADIPNYLTTMVPSNYAFGNTKVFGRININTAPWFVIAQLPWMSDRRLGGTGTFWDNYKLARAIVAYRDKFNISGGPAYSGRAGSVGFGSIAEMSHVVDGADLSYRIDWYATDGNDLTGLPRVFQNVVSGVADDFEERDVILSRISNLATVRSDVFCAYILLRLGEDGPQRRFIAVLDRSGVINASGRVRIRALQPVADPR